MERKNVNFAIRKAADEMLKELVRIRQEKEPHLVHTKMSVVADLVFQALKREKRK